ncbi:MAG TPA: hypothetical protein VFA56_01805 [Gaiellaceae bacterium]|nr:hypothetical protein [Gaiellaceae bacterium]
MSAIRHRPPYSALDLPHPQRVAAIFALLCAAALALEADPGLPWVVGVAAALLFGTAGTIEAYREHRELAEVRRTADRLIATLPTNRDASELVRWRCAELTSTQTRERLARDVQRTLRALGPGRLPSASPLRRPEARAARALLEQLERRLRDKRPVSARGILYVRIIFTDPSSPLYDDGSDGDLARLIRRALGALEP